MTPTPRNYYLDSEYLSVVMIGVCVIAQTCDARGKVCVEADGGAGALRFFNSTFGDILEMFITD